MYKKYLSVSIMMLAPMCANAGGDYTAAIQQLDAEIARLQAQNQADLEELQECEKKVKGFKISGITTLSLTGVGIGVNIGEAVKLNKLEQQSSALTVKEFLSSNVQGHETGYEYLDFSGDKSSTTQYVKKKGDWAAIYDYGVITGVAKCSTTSGEEDKTGNPQGDTGKYCWCKMTQLKKTRENNFLPAESHWVFRVAYESDSNCASDCTYYCGKSAQGDRSFRRGLFGSIE